MRDLPLRVRQLDRSIASGRRPAARWPHDIALGRAARAADRLHRAATGGPGGRDTFYLRALGRLGLAPVPDRVRRRGALTFHSGGITFDHARPSRVVLSRTIGVWNEVELWRTPDGGRTWLDADPGHEQLGRPQLPARSSSAGLTGPRLVVVYVHGTASSFRNFQTVVRMDIAD